MRSFQQKAKAARLCCMLAVALLAGCANVSSRLNSDQPATVTAVTEQNLSLRLLPAPTQRVTVAVYDLPDLTGQFRERDNVQSLSRAVSQGGAPMLIKALQDAGERSWFTILDRSSLDDLLRERQIVTEMRRIYRGETEPDPSAIAPLRHAGVIIQGAIIGYDSNVQTGGFGARYLGVGGDRQWKLDIVTVSLRAVSSETGEVLANVMVEKPIASTLLRGGVFSYVELDRLLEVDTGVAANEPKQLAVQMAIEKAVFTLILEGAQIGIWSFADSNAQGQLLSHYRAEKYREEGAAAVNLRPAPPETRNPTRTVPTIPLARNRTAPVVQQRVLPPAATPRPTVGTADEVIG